MQIVRRSNLLHEQQTNELLILLRSAELSDFSAKCVAFTERVLCSACDPEVGVGNLDSVCVSLCDEWYAACKDEFWEVQKQRPFPCMPSALVCSPLSEFVSTGAEFCKQMRFDVGYPPAECYDGSSRPRTRPRSRSSRTTKRRTKTKGAKHEPPPWEGYELAFGASVAVAVGILSWKHVQHFLDPSDNAPRRFENNGNDDDDFQ